MTRAAVFGAGSWGTAFAQVLADAGVDRVTIWARREPVARSVAEQHRNPDYLEDVDLPAQITATTDPGEAARDADVVVLAVPSQTLRDNLQDWKDLIPPQALVVSLMKGIELGTGLRMSEVIEAAGIDRDRIVVVSGPNLSREIAARQPAASVVACTDIAAAERVAAMTATPYFRPYTQTDVVGAEIGGAVKNVIALAVGMAEGLGYGDNTKSSLITRGLAEVVRLGQALGADPATLTGLAGVGDLIATCMSPLSRNHRVGVALGQGRTIAELLALPHQTAEGVKSCRSVVGLAARNGVDMPICQGVTAVVDGRVTPEQLTGALMSRARKHELA
ncbi:NAD(P)H-dependent glycerol-3-phosphate dehydrogenase [Ornithinimicrobium pekingense]|uniref:Glycerol-3-phosphate dehydrogenase [NAD(P)+] n=1 Tax=Ornithinimicrobium pekingense TaxID=384677 RepID=A0ABQ2F5W1_9MICO|nr:NAD(P)H-dependent glycerol-3-phosphate dehydrogenase [Ornithinimicrobium pekingense]GGK62772.1 glycerol-3-phosphate dehydrogenase [NAD(P)+] [Ornithinimicrobium pekingense]